MTAGGPDRNGTRGGRLCPPRRGAALPSGRSWPIIVPGCVKRFRLKRTDGAPRAYTPSRRSIRADSRASSCDRFFTWVVRFEMITE